jgi:hypothetical protein
MKWIQKIFCLKNEESKDNQYIFQTGDVITLKKDNILRTVRFEREGMVCADWIDDGYPKQIKVKKNKVKLIKITPYQS